MKEKQVIDTQSLDYNNALTFKTSDNRNAILVSIKDTESDFALFILEEDNDTIYRAFRLNNCYPTLDTAIHADEELSTELTFEWNFTGVPIENNPNANIAIKKYALKNMFHSVYFYQGIECSDCNDQYYLDQNDYIITDGFTIVGRDGYRGEVSVLNSTYVIIVETRKDNPRDFDLNLYLNEPDLDVSYNKIIESLEKINSSYEKVYQFIYDYLEV